MKKFSALCNALTALGLSLLLAAAPALARENVVLVLDASGSMWGQIDGRSKVEIGREAVGHLLDNWNAEHGLGLMAYGHNRRGDCADIELLIAPGPPDIASFRRTVNGLNARGMTPLSAAVQRAAEALKSSEQKATVILVSDGEENCGLDPCQIGKQLAAEGIDFTAHVIGFDLNDATREAGLRCLAENTGGLYFRADDAASLSQSLGALAALATAPVRPGGTAELDAPASAVEAGLLTLRYRGPAARGDYIALVNADGFERAHAWVRPGEETGELSIRLPAGAGNHVLRYVGVLNDPSTLAEQPLELVPAEALIDAPESVMQGSVVVVRVRGPVGDGNHWIAIAPAGAAIGEYLRWELLSAAEQSLELLAPSEPGEYEVRFVLDGADVPLVARPLRVSPAEILISGPVQVQAGDRFSVRAVGPKHNEFWITIVEAEAGEGEFRSWSMLEVGRDDYELTAPNAPGQYELRYQLVNPLRVMARQPIQVLPATVSWDGPGSVRAGEHFLFTVKGPIGEGSYLTLVPAGSPPGHYEAWQWTQASAEYQWLAPEQAGAWELRYMLGDGSVLAGTPVRVVDP